MHKLFMRLLAVSALLCAAGVASATTFPNAAFPDSVTIQQIQDISLLSHLTAPDTVGEVRVNIPNRVPPYDNPFGGGLTGVITGFDPIATGFDLYLQDPAGGPFSGVDVFTHSTNTKVAPYNFAIGDRISVEYMNTAEFQGATEVLATNNNFGAPNFILRKISSGNPLPPFFVGTTTQFNENATNTFAEQYEGCLVRMVGPLTVVRTSLTGGMGPGNINNAANTFLVINPSAPADSVFIDGSKLTTFAPPAVGTPIASIQGIMNQATRGYRIMLRDGNDIVSNTPPNVTDGYPVTDTKIRVKFDRNVTSITATNPLNYSLGSGGSIGTITMFGLDAVEVDIVNGLLHGDIETITINNVAGSAALLPMTLAQTRTFVNGILTAEEVERPNPDSLAAAIPACVDKSRFAGTGGQLTQGGLGTRASMGATVASRYGSIYYMADAGNGVHSGVAAFAPPAVLTIGNQYRLTGQIQEFFGETEFSNINEVADLGASSVPAPVIVSVGNVARDTCDFSNAFTDGEEYEGRLVRVTNAKVVQRFLTLPTNGFHIVDLSTHPDTIFVENFNAVLTPLVAPPLGDLVTITGTVHYSGASFRIVPRNYGDIVDGGTADVSGGANRLSFSVYPNPSRTATLSFTLPQSEDVSIGIYDVAGRQVLSLFNGRLAAGNHTREWTGLDASGRNVGAGVFFARIKAGDATRAVRAVYLGR